MFKENEGIQDVLTYIGGLFVQLPFESQELAMDFKEKAVRKLNASFRSLTEWVPLVYVKQILDRVIGLPPQYWSRQVVEKTVITWGENIGDGVRVEVMVTEDVTAYALIAPSLCDDDDCGSIEFDSDKEWEDFIKEHAAYDGDWNSRIQPKAKCYNNIRMFKKKEGIQDVLRYIGGLFLQLQFESQELEMDFKEKALAFPSLDCLNNIGQDKWLRKQLEHRVKILEVEDSYIGSDNRERMVLSMKTSFQQCINDYVVVVIDGVRVQVLIIEDVAASALMAPSLCDDDVCGSIESTLTKMVRFD
ncbi:hypothetical protein L2E82_38947 [Cichorium intybus]|uniref:Uncharacterized protein n=1 Tax=Cichorium intybus TaxID=13427 RepID=A0ACB9AIJ8_CICIN|nr:hypothetical protein L2E82_38947 [Cichorium intybus]